MTVEKVCATRRSRAPDAAERSCGALQSRGHERLRKFSAESAPGKTRASPLVRHARAVEMLFDLGTVAGALETGAEQLGLLQRNRRAIQSAHEFGRCATLAGTRPAFGEKHAVPADAGIEPLMCRVEVIEDLAQRIAQPDALVGSERDDGVQHVIDRIVLAQTLFALRSDVQHDRTLVFVRRLSHQEGLAL